MDCRIRKLTVRGSRLAVGSRIVLGVENALRTASFPGIPPNALVIVRSLRLRLPEGPLGFLATAQQLDETGRLLAAQAVAATSPEAARSPVVWFQDALEPMAFLALQLARGRVPREWFWKGAVPDWNGGYGTHELPRLMKTAGRCSLPQAAMGRVLAVLLAAHRLECLLDALSIEDGRELLGLFGFQDPPELQSLQFSKGSTLAGFLMGLDESLRQCIQSRIGRWGVRDPRTLWLLALLLWLRHPSHRKNVFERQSFSPRATSDHGAPHGTAFRPRKGSWKDFLLERPEVSDLALFPAKSPLPDKANNQVPPPNEHNHPPVTMTAQSCGHGAQTGHWDGPGAPSFSQPGAPIPVIGADRASPMTTRALQRKQAQRKTYAAPGIGRLRKEAPLLPAVSQAEEGFLKTEDLFEHTDPHGATADTKTEEGFIPMEHSLKASPSKGAGTQGTDPQQGLFPRPPSVAGPPPIDPRDIQGAGHHPVEDSPAHPLTLRSSPARERVFAAAAFHDGIFVQDGAKSRDILPSLGGLRSPCGGFLFLLGLLEVLGLKDSLDWPLPSGHAVGECLLGFLGRILPLPHDDPHWALVPSGSCLGEDLPDDFSFHPPEPWVDLLTERAQTMRRLGFQTFRTQRGSFVLADRTGRLVFGLSHDLSAGSDDECAHVPNIPLTPLLEGFFRAVRCIVALFLHRRVGWTLRRLVFRPARVVLSPTHVDVFFRLEQADAAIRRWGLDINPGWVPWLARVISFHYSD